MPRTMSHDYWQYAPTGEFAAPPFNQPQPQNQAPSLAPNFDFGQFDVPSQVESMQTGMPSVDYSSLGMFGGGQQQPYRVPYNALGAMLGIEMPDMPSRDDAGRYGITDTQMQDANNQGMAQSFFGAAQSFLGGGAAPSIQGGMNAGTVRRGALDKASLANAQDYEMRMKNAIAQVELVKSRSAAELAQINAEDGYMKLDQAKKQRAIVDAWAENNAPVAAKYVARASAVSESLGTEIKNQFLKMQEYAQKGDLEKADATYNQIQMKFAALDPTGEEARRLDEDFKTATLQGMMKHKVDAAVFKGVLDMPEFKGYGVEMGPDGAPRFITPYQQELREVQLQQERVQSSLYAAQAQRQQALALGLEKIKPANVAKAVTAANKGYELATLPKPTDPAGIQRWEKDRALGAAALMDIGVDVNDPNRMAWWKGLGVNEKNSFVTDQKKREAFMAAGVIDPSILTGYGPSTGPQGGGGTGMVGGAAPPQPGQLPPPSSLPRSMALVGDFMKNLNKVNDQDAYIALNALGTMNESGMRTYLPMIQGNTYKEKMINLYTQMFGNGGYTGQALAVPGLMGSPGMLQNPGLDAVVGRNAMGGMTSARER